MLALSKHEEEFFRAWEREPTSERHDFSDLDDGHQPRTVWRALVGWLAGDAQHAE